MGHDGALAALLRRTHQTAQRPEAKTSNMMLIDFLVMGMSPRPPRMRSAPIENDSAPSTEASTLVPR